MCALGRCELGAGGYVHVSGADGKVRVCASLCRWVGVRVGVLEAQCISILRIWVITCLSFPCIHRNFNNSMIIKCFLVVPSMGLPYWPSVVFSENQIPHSFILGKQSPISAVKRFISQSRSSQISPGQSGGQSEAEMRRQRASHLCYLLSVRKEGGFPSWHRRANFRAYKCKYRQ